MKSSIKTDVVKMCIVTVAVVLSLMSAGHGGGGDGDKSPKTRFAYRGETENHLKETRGNDTPPAPLSEPESEQEQTVDAEYTSFTDTRDGQTYRTVKIGNLTWMAENLNFKTDGSWCYDNDEANCRKYGRLYDWNTAMTACPAGWRLSNAADWDYLFETVGGDAMAIMKLKSKTGWDLCYDEHDGVYRKCDGNSTNDFDFSAMPGGAYFHESNQSFFRHAGAESYFWVDDSHMAYRNIGSNSYGGGIGNKSNAFSVRCVDDAVQTAAEPEQVQSSQENIKAQMAGFWRMQWPNPDNAIIMILFADGRWESSGPLPTDHTSKGSFVIAREENGIYYLRHTIEHSTSPYTEIGSNFEDYKYDAQNERIGIVLHSGEGEQTVWFTKE
ncbi:MAG: fibrobacter succinogenes major paralogous domain-containing protein [Chitinispirillales bacterium]|nr:fibrobacter succinogenes major paralogous domain-containing protein [Chitinispirillales bacterium]